MRVTKKSNNNPHRHLTDTQRRWCQRGCLNMSWRHGGDHSKWLEVKSFVLCHVMWCNAMSCDVLTSRDVIWCEVMRCNGMGCTALVMRCGWLCEVMLCDWKRLYDVVNWKMMCCKLREPICHSTTTPYFKVVYRTAIIATKNYSVLQSNQIRQGILPRTTKYYSVEIRLRVACLI